MRAIARAAYRRGARSSTSRGSTRTSSWRAPSTRPRTRSTGCRPGTASASPRSARWPAPPSRWPAPPRPASSTTSTRRRPARDRLPSVREGIPVIMGAQVNWTVVPCPNPAWAQLVHPDLAPDAALRPALGRDRPHLPPRRARPGRGLARPRRRSSPPSAERLNARRLSAVRFVGPGTDLTVGLLPELALDRRRRPRAATACPTCRTSPPRRCSRRPTRAHRGPRRPPPSRSTWAARSSAACACASRAGRAVEIDADSGAEVLRARAAVDEGAARLGEVALVDGSGRIGPLDITFFDTLLDENATSHIALGAGYPKGAPDEADRINDSRDPHRLHDRRPGGDRARHRRRRQRGGDPRERHLARRALSASRRRGRRTRTPRWPR